jgi:hypothetical protein
MDTAPVSTSSSAASSVDGRGGAAGGSEFLNLGMFGSGQPSAVSDILLGSGGAFGGGTLGNGYGNDASSGPTSSSTFDLNDFPSLGGGPPGSGAGTLSSTGSLSSASGNGLAAALRQQQQLAHQQMLQVGAVNKNASAVTNSSNLYRLAMQAGANGVNANFNMATEDFPALPGPPPSSGNVGGSNGSILGPGNSTLLLDGNGGSSLVAGNSFGGQSVSRGLSSGGAGGSYAGDMDGGSNALDGNGLLGGVGLGALGGLSGLSSMSVNPTALGHQLSGTAMTTATSGQPSGAANSAAGSALGGDFGLLGLLSVIRMTDADRNALALGTDLTMLGLNLNSTENLYSNFASPYSEVPATKEPHYQVSLVFMEWGGDRYELCVLYTDDDHGHGISASDVLLYATAGAKDGSLVKVPTGNAVLHFLRPPEGCSASLFGSRIVHKGMEVSCRVEEMVQACDPTGWRGSYTEWCRSVLVL